jgi:hypothetical protein
MQLRNKTTRTKKAAAPVNAPESAILAHVPAIVPGAPTASALDSAPATPESAAPVKPSAADSRAAYIADAATAKAIFAALDSAISIPIKPGAFKPKALNPKAYDLSPRGAAAIYCAVAASGKPLADGETYARRFTIGGISYVIENGAFSDFIGTAYTVDSANGLGRESFTLLPGAVAAIRGKLGAKISAFKL